MESSKVKMGYVREDGMIFWKSKIWLTPEKFNQYKQKQKLCALKFESNPSYRKIKREKNKKYYKENIYKERKRSIEKYKNLSDEKKLQTKEIKRKWHLENKSKVKANKQRRREREKSILSKNQLMIISVFYQQSKRLSDNIGIKFHVDHIVPLNQGGKHIPSNLQVIPARLNLIKGKNKIFVWAK